MIELTTEKTPNLVISTSSERFPWNICGWCGMPTGALTPPPLHISDLFGIYCWVFPKVMFQGFAFWVPVSVLLYFLKTIYNVPLKSKNRSKLPERIKYSIYWISYLQGLNPCWTRTNNANFLFLHCTSRTFKRSETNELNISICIM